MYVFVRLAIGLYVNILMHAYSCFRASYVYVLFICACCTYTYAPRGRNMGVFMCFELQKVRISLCVITVD